MQIFSFEFNVPLYLKFLVFLDFFAVSLIVPLLSSYFRDAGVDTKLYGLISSLYSASQLIGGIAIGFIADNISKRNVLLISFIGSGISYFIVGTSSSLYLLFGSRVLVGLVKQTISTSTAAFTELTPTNPEERTRHLSHISALTTSAFIVGPSLGGILYNFHRSLPAIVASSCFALNTVICFFLLPQNEIMEFKQKNSALKSNCNHLDSSSEINGKSSETKLGNMWKTFKELLAYPSLGRVLMCRILLIFVESSMSSRNVINYYETKFGLETYQIGFMSSGTMCVSILVQVFLLSWVLRYFHGNVDTKRPLTDASQYTAPDISVYEDLMILSIGVVIYSEIFEQFSSNFPIFCAMSLLPNIITRTILSEVSKSAFTLAVPPDHIGKALGVFNTVTTGLGIVAPLYGALVFDYFGGVKTKAGVSACHFALLLACIWIPRRLTQATRHEKQS